MALLSMQQVNDRAAALLDDPGHRRFSSDYLRNHIDQQNEAMMLVLEPMGVQQQEQIAIFNIPAGTTDLTPYFNQGQPLAAFLRPLSIEYKLQGTADVTYMPSWPTKELQDVLPSNLGNEQYTWQGGVLQVTPSGTATTLRVHYLALTAQIWDSSAQVMRGTGFIIAAMTARFVASLNNGMGALIKQLDAEVKSNKRNLKSLLVQQQQGKNMFPRGIRRTTVPVISAGGSSYS